MSEFEVYVKTKKVVEIRIMYLTLRNFELGPLSSSKEKLRGDLIPGYKMEREKI